MCRYRIYLHSYLYKRVCYPWNVFSYARVDSHILVHPFHLLKERYAYISAQSFLSATHSSFSFLLIIILAPISFHTIMLLHFVHNLVIYQVPLYFNSLVLLKFLEDPFLPCSIIQSLSVVPLVIFYSSLTSLDLP